MLRQEVVNLRMTPEEKQALIELADDQQRSMSGQVRHWIHEEKRKRDATRKLQESEHAASR